MPHARHERVGHDRGFTLIELLIVIVIMGVLASVTVMGVSQFRSDSKTAACDADLHNVRTAANAFQAGHGGKFPASLGQLTDA
ncbi:MAG: type II secretion system protein, partial [Mycobacteriales bacterium]